MEVEGHERLDRPTEAVGKRDDEGRAARESALREIEDDGHRCGHQRGLCDEQYVRRVPDPVQRRENGDDRVEVVSEDVVAGALERHQRSVEPGVLPNRLIEDAKVVTRGEHRRLPGHRVDAVESEDGDGQDRDRPVCPGHVDRTAQPGRVESAGCDGLGRGAGHVPTMPAGRRLPARRSRPAAPFGTGVAPHPVRRIRPSAAPGPRTRRGRGARPGEHRGQRRDLLRGRLAAHHPQNRRSIHSGMFPCFLGGSVSRLLRSMRSDLMT